MLEKLKSKTLWVGLVGAVALDLGHSSTYKSAAKWLTKSLTASQH